jgi:hypothetical protein
MVERVLRSIIFFDGVQPLLTSPMTADNVLYQPSFQTPSTVLHYRTQDHPCRLPSTSRVDERGDS